ncbi:integrase catalytic subunit [Anoxybacillus flavithermus NBRC 109594]|uniref:Integrase catalytic subunit n=1 Tax=Anoxybacillus flavithermus NBRC 109594 TaxID=1315967 RepID=R4G686_9BACL|nr:integrase catalytic subunit [Anoxybacillus flavithermus NBRC 109594]
MNQPFEVNEPVANITDIRTKEGWLYFASIRICFLVKL